MKRIQFFIDKFSYGSTESQVLTLANSLVDLYKIEIICLEKCRDINLHKNIRLVCVDKKRSFINKINTISLVKDLNERIEEFNPDIIVINDLSFLKFIDKLNTTNRKTFYWMQHLIEDKYQEKLKRFDYVIVCSKHIKDKLENNRNIIVIPDAVSLDLKKEDYNNDTKLVTIAKLNLNKTIINLIDMMELIVAHNPKIILNIIGDGEERDKVVDLIRTKNLNRNIHLFGFYNSQDLNEELIDSSLYISLSYDEIFELSVLEAMSVGLPVIAFDGSPTIKEIITDDIDGCLVEKDDIKNLCEKIISLLKDKERRKSLGNCALEKSVGYNINVIKIEWIKLFN